VTAVLGEVDRATGAVRIESVAGDELAARTAGLWLSATTALSVPALEVDSDDVYALSLAFYDDADLRLIVVASEQDVPDSVVGFVLAELTALASDPASTSADIARRVRGVAVGALRHRLRAVETSVRRALDDDDVTADDYTALREYPARLAQVERLVRELPAPDDAEALGWVADEAKQSVAQLSGLIASQQYLLAHRQAVEVHRFQRLLTLIGTAVLVPGLVTAMFGANVGFHGRDSSAAFWAMLLLMLAGGTGGYTLLRSAELGIWPRLFQRVDLSPERRLLVLLLFTLLAGAAGLLVLLAA
jgi:hypothetical protein